jgi:hypothetical protein
MKKASAKGISDDLRAEYDLSQLKGGVRGKYHREATAGTNLVLIEHALRSACTNLIAPSRGRKDADHKSGGPRYRLCSDGR